MAKNKNRTFCIEYETGLSKKDRDLCEKKLRIGRSIYNACLGEALKRLNNCHNDPRYKQLSKNYKESESFLISIRLIYNRVVRKISIYGYILHS